MTMLKPLHTRDEIDIVYVLLKEEVSSIKHSVDTSIFWLEDQRKTNYSHQKPKKQHKNQQNKNDWLEDQRLITATKSLKDNIKINRIKMIDLKIKD